MNFDETSIARPIVLLFLNYKFSLTLSSSRFGVVVELFVEKTLPHGGVPGFVEDSA